MVSVTQREQAMDLVLYQLEHRMGRNYFNQPFRAFEWPVPEVATAAWMPLVDIFENTDSVRLVAEVPGVRPEDVNLAVEGNRLTITGTKELAAEDQAAKGHYHERTCGSFERTFRLSAAIDLNTVRATYDLGVLTITLWKAESAKRHQIAVEVRPEKALQALQALPA